MHNVYIGPLSLSFLSEKLRHLINHPRVEREYFFQAIVLRLCNAMSGGLDYPVLMKIQTTNAWITSQLNEGIHNND